MIYSKDISVVVQGEVNYEYTSQCLKSIRRNLPDATIILSTWEGTNVDGLDFDKVIYNKDPGYFYYSKREGEKKNNVNRQIVSTVAGLKACTTEYAFKIRCDFIITGNKFIEFFNMFPLVDSKYKVFDQKILSCCYFARKPQIFPFHPSDFAFFGKVSCLLKLFDVSLMTKKEAEWDTTNNFLNKYVPEQHIFINCLQKNGFDVCCKYYNDNNPKAIEQTERYFASNFIFLDFNQFNLKPMKKEFNIIIPPDSFMNCYTHIEWQHLYKKYVDNDFNVFIKDNQRLHLEKMQRKYKRILAFCRIIAFPIIYRKLRRNFRNKLLKIILDKVNQ